MLTLMICHDDAASFKLQQFPFLFWSFDAFTHGIIAHHQGGANVERTQDGYIYTFDSWTSGYNFLLRLLNIAESTFV